MAKPSQIQALCDAIESGALPDADVAKLKRALIEHGPAHGLELPPAWRPATAAAPGTDTLESMRRQPFEPATRAARERLATRRCFDGAARADAEARAAEQPEPVTLSVAQQLERDDAVRSVSRAFAGSVAAHVEAQRAATEWSALAQRGLTSQSLRSYVETCVRRWAARTPADEAWQG